MLFTKHLNFHAWKCAPYCPRRFRPAQQTRSKTAKGGQIDELPHSQANNARSRIYYKQSLMFIYNNEKLNVTLLIANTTPLLVTA